MYDCIKTIPSVMSFTKDTAKIQDVGTSLAVQ